VNLLPAGRIKESAIHVPPDALDELGVLADQPPGALFERVLRSAFADTENSWASVSTVTTMLL
jgi:hypothetical protein